ncbi:hypothetical protein FB45DRAFT_867848 [Roridomyces roridus]|uniref:Uncharacterized protein n=1 Tax=Roridomyces roridus TaxID=1738132 RepID=A0AAD7BST5_9AGAR|nr:hypothetical protein FB45DRAFT_867848 [Roridomyces roridus]
MHIAYGGFGFGETVQLALCSILIRPIIDRKRILALPAQKLKQNRSATDDVKFRLTDTVTTLSDSTPIDLKEGMHPGSRVPIYVLHGLFRKYQLSLVLLKRYQGDGRLTPVLAQSVQLVGWKSRMILVIDELLVWARRRRVFVGFEVTPSVLLPVKKSTLSSSANKFKRSSLSLRVLCEEIPSVLAAASLDKIAEAEDDHATDLLLPLQTQRRDGQTELGQELPGLFGNEHDWTLKNPTPSVFAEFKGHIHAVESLHLDFHLVGLRRQWRPARMAQNLAKYHRDSRYQRVAGVGKKANGP